jgi:hypothetical protein
MGAEMKISAVVLITLGTLWGVALAHAGEQTPAKATHGIDFTRPLLTLDGKPITNPDKTPVTVGGVAASCLVQEKESPGEGPALWALAVRIANAKDATLDAAEVHAIETCLADKPALVSGQIIPLIDPNYKPAPLR